MTDDYDPEEAVTITVAARRLGCDPSTVRKLLTRGELTGHRVGIGREPRGIRVHAESIRDYKARHAIIARGAPAPVPAPRRRDLAAVRSMQKELERLGVSLRPDADAAIRRQRRRGPER